MVFIGLVSFSLKLDKKLLGKSNFPESSPQSSLVTLIPVDSTPTPISTPPLASQFVLPRTSLGTLPSNSEIDFNVYLEFLSDLNSNIRFEFSGQENSREMKAFEIDIPSGWEFTKGELVNQGAIIGNGTIDHVFNNSRIQTKLTVVNDQDTQGHKAHWRILLGEPNVNFEMFVDGELSKGHKIITSRAFIEGLKTPSRFEMAIFSTVGNPGGQGKKGEVVFSGSSRPGDYNFGALVNFFDGNSLKIEKVLSII